MSIQDKGTAESFIRGGDILWHRGSIFVKNVARVLGVVVVFLLLVWWAVVRLMASSAEYQVITANRFAAAMNLVFLGNVVHQRVAIADGTGQILADRKVSSREALALTDAAYRDHGRAKVWLGFMLAIAIGGTLFAVSIFVQTRYGRKESSDTFLRGARLVDEEYLATLSREYGEPSPFKIGTVPVPARLAMRNMLFTGSMGTGKTQEIFYLLDQARDAGLKCLVYDKTGEFLERYFREGDVILNPLDARSVSWSAFADVTQVFDFAAISSFFVPENKKSADPMWDNAARILLEDLMQIVHDGPLEERTMARIVDLLKLSLPELATFLREHDAFSCGLVNENNERGSESTRLTVAASPAVRFFRYLPTSGEPFSVRKWATEEDTRWLFLTSRSDLHEVIKPFISLWIESVLMAVMTRRPTDKIRVALFLDELASLQKMKGLEVALTEARKYGVVSILGIQNLAQLDEVYGADMAKVLTSGVQTKLILRVEDEATQKRYADLLGEEEVQEKDEGASFSANDDRDSGSLQSRRQARHIVMPAQIGTLPDLAGYLKLPGNFPVARVVITPKSRPAVVPDFVARPELAIIASAILADEDGVILPGASAPLPETPVDIPARLPDVPASSFF